MSYIETMKYDPNTKDSSFSYMYEGENVQVITVFKDINMAIVEDKNGKIFEISTEQLQSAS
ncbi:hypothetical protein KKA17_06970 [bacterium]|nr:hypothetical protein [bacterium]MBU1884355.1 hypothetical protein [bacterium]